MKSLNRFSVKGRLFVTAVVFIAALAGVTGFEMWQAAEFSRTARMIREHPLRVANATLHIELYATRMHRNMRDVVLSRSTAEINRAAARTAADEKVLYEQLDIVRQFILGNEGKRLEREARKAYDAWRPVRAGIIRLMRQGRRDEAEKLLKSKGLVCFRNTEEKQRALSAYPHRKAATLIAMMDERERRMQVLAGTLFAGVSLLVVAGAFLTFRSITSGLDKLRRIMDESDPSGALLNAEVEGTDEIAEMAASYNTLVNSLRKHRVFLEDIVRARTAELEESREWLSITLKSIGDAVIATDAAGNITFMNPVAEALTGWTLAEARGLPLEKAFSIVNEDTKEIMENPVRKVLETGGVVGLANHTALISRDGGQHPIVDSGAPIAGEDGKIHGVVLVFSDDSARREAEKKVLDSEERYRLMFENMSSAVAVYEAVEDGADFIFKAFNKAAEKAEVIDRSLVLGRKVTKVFPGVVEFGIHDVFKRVWETGVPEYFPVSIYKDARIAGWRENYVYRLATGEVIAVYDDVTALKQAEEELKNSREWLATTLKSIGDAVIATDVSGKITFMNPIAEELTGWAFADAEGQQLEEVFSIINEETRAVRENPVRKVLETGGIVGLANHTALISRGGREYPIVDSGAPIAGEDGQIIGVILVFRDDSARRKWERELVNEKEKLDSIMEAMPDSLVICDLNYELTYLNAAARRWLGNSLGRKCHAALEEKDAPCGGCPVRAAFSDGKIHTTVIERETTRGKKEYWEYTAIPIKDFEGRITSSIAIRKNITEHVEVEKLLIKRREQEKLAAVGSMAGKMAHDFNNLLGIIMGTSELLLAETGMPEETKSEIEIIRDSALRGRDITRDLILFAKDQEPKYSRFDLNDKVSHVVSSLKHELAMVDMALNFGADTGFIVADPGLLENTLINLIRNSVDALSKTGKPEISIKTYLESGCVCIEISDNGCGIPPEYHQKVFEPVFTLKGGEDKTGAYIPGVKGTGYGLANVKRFVEKHNGTITLESEVNRGTRIKISLPVILEELSGQELERVKACEIPGGMRILIVEDEQQYGRILYSVLSQCGHTAHLAPDGKMALDLFSQNRYDAISLDFVLPDMSGVDVYRKIREADKDIPVIFVSGNFEFMQSMIDLKKNDDRVDHLAKPFNNIDYINAVHKWLDG